MKFLLLLTFFLITSVHAQVRFLTLSDIHFGAKNKSADGQDTGPEFMKITMNKMKQLSKDVDFILFLGDIPTHTLFFNPDKANIEKTVFHDLFLSDINQKPMFYISGNNDSLGGNYQAFETNGVTPLTYATDWDGACVFCKGLIIDDSHMHSANYYSSYVVPDNKDIILIALNTTQWTKIPWIKRVIFSKLAYQEDNAKTQLAWLEDQLKNNHAKQLLIAMHEPPGKTFLGEEIWYKKYQERFIKILNKYNRLYGQITLLVSHTHMEEFRRITLDNKIHIYAYATPGISRNHHNYPGMKIFTLNNEYKIKNFITYYTSQLHQWNDELYHSSGNPDAIFSKCTHKTLTKCLDDLSVDQVCDALDRGFFYGVKNPKVNDISCRKTYPVN